MVRHGEDLLEYNLSITKNLDWAKVINKFLSTVWWYRKKFSSLKAKNKTKDTDEREMTDVDVVEGKEGDRGPATNEKLPTYHQRDKDYYAQRMAVGAALHRLQCRQHQDSDHDAS